jgi:molybdopterin synthase sulfur carrier subunit
MNNSSVVDAGNQGTRGDDSKHLQVKVEIPFHLQRLAHCGGELVLELAAPFTQRMLINSLELAHPPLAGAVIDPHTGARRPLLRFFACQQDQSFLGLDAVLPEAVLLGREPFLIVGAISGG